MGLFGMFGLFSNLDVCAEFEAFQKARPLKFFTLKIPPK